MPAPTNLGFETPGTAGPGSAASWSLSVLSSAFELGGFFAGQNLVQRSAEFDSTAWGKSGATVTANAITTWDGQAIADALVDTVANAAHDVFQTTSATSGSVKLAVEAKAGAKSWIWIATSNGARSCFFNIAAGTVGTVTGLGASGAITALGDGWYRCEFTDPTVSGGSGIVTIGAASADLTAVYVGTGTAAVYLARAQQRTAAAAALGVPYITTTEFELDIYVPRENFESLWTNTGYELDFIASDLAAAVFDSGGPYVTENVEDFEEGWSSNQTYLLASDGQLATGLFDSGGEGFENFENGWLSNETYLAAFSGGDLSAGTFDSAGTPEAFEDFEELWYTGSYLAAFGGGDLSFALFSDVWTDDVEDFERYLTPLTVGSLNDTTDVITIASHGLFQDEPIQFTIQVGGTLPDDLEVGQRYFVAFLTSNTFKVTLAPSSGIFVDIKPGVVGTVTVIGDPLAFWPEATSAWT